MMERFNQLLRRQSRSVYLLAILFFIAGCLALWVLPSGIYPEVTFPRVIVVVDAGDVAQQNLLPLVTRPIEESVSKIPGFRQVHSLTLRGSVEISVEFSNQTDIELALQQVRGRVGELRASFPNSTNITIERLTPSVFPVLSYNIVASNLSIPALTDITNYQIRPRLLQVPGVAQVKVQSAQTPEIAVEVDPERLASLQISLNQITTAIQQTNQVTVIGLSQQQHQQSLILGSAEMFNPDNFRKTVVATRGNIPVTLGEIADVHVGANDKITVFNGNGHPAVLLSILKQPDSNLIELTDQIQHQWPKIIQSLPKGVRVQPVYNLAELVSASIDNLRDAILIGIAFIVLVIYLFLRDWRSTWIAAMTIPVTIAVTFGVMCLGHQTLNLMSLGGLAVAVGLVIDDAIVMIEGIFHHLQTGLNPMESSRKALSELAEPILSSTLTTIVVFAPLGLLEGVVGQFFTALSFTLATSVVISLVVALTLIPLLCQRFLKSKRETKKDGNIAYKSYSKILTKLKHFSDRASSRIGIVSVIIVVMLLLLLPLGQALEKGFMPEMDEGSFVLDYYAPPGTSLEDTDRIVHQMEMILSHTPEVKNFSRRTGSQLGLQASETSSGDILVRLLPLSQRHRSTDQVMDAVREKVTHQLPGVDVEFTQILQDLINDLADSPAPIAIKIYGTDPDQLKMLATKVGDILSSVKGVVDVNTHTRPSAIEEKVQVDPVAASRFGLSVADILTQVQTALLGNYVTNAREQEKMIPVRVRYLDSVRRHYNENLSILPIYNMLGIVVPLGTLAHIEKNAGQMEIRRENLARLAMVTGRLENRDLGGAMADIRQKMKDIRLPNGYYIGYGGQWSSQQTAFTNLSLVMALGILLVYLVLVIQFGSLLTPLPILLAIPLSLLGVFVGLLATGTALNISSFMGIILLVGLVVKNGIILLTFAQQRMVHGLSAKEAVAEAVRLRFRPIMMTTLCTLLGLLPLALGFGTGAEMQKPLAIAVISGLSISTLITLFITPALFQLTTRVKISSVRQ